MRDDGGGDLDDRNSSVVDGCDKACEVASDATTEGDHERGTVVTSLDEAAAELIGLAHGLGAFAGRELMGGDLIARLGEGGDGGI